MSEAVKRYKIVNAVVGGLAFLLTEAGREFYRPYIYSHGIDDFRIADTLGNSFGTIATVFIILSLTGKNNSWDYRYIAILALGLCGYELMQGPMGGAIDPYDILATLVSGVCCLALYRILHHHPYTLRGS